MSVIIKQTYIIPSVLTVRFVSDLMQIPSTLPQGNTDDPEIVDEDDELVKERKNSSWEPLW